MVIDKEKLEQRLKVYVWLMVSTWVVLLLIDALWLWVFDIKQFMLIPFFLIPPAI